MKDLLSPGSLVTVAGGVLTVVGAVAYGTGNANLSLPTIFYGIPILLGGLALKSSELPPAIRVTAQAALKRNANCGTRTGQVAGRRDALALWPEGPSGVIAGSAQALG